jgi:hypothetical protein
MFDILKVKAENNTVRTTQLDFEDGYSAQRIADSRGITFGGINPGNTREAIGQKVRGRCPDAPAVNSSPTGRVACSADAAPRAHARRALRLLRRRSRLFEKREKTLCAGTQHVLCRRPTTWRRCSTASLR